MMPSIVVPAYPYEGGFHWFLDPRPGFLSHPYYSVLYGRHREAVAPRSAALACLFDEVVLAPADVWLPDRQAAETGRLYYHDDLRLKMDWGEPEWSNERDLLVRRLLEAPSLSGILNEEPTLRGNLDAQFRFVSRILLQIRVATEEGAVLLGNSYFHRVRNAILLLMGRYTEASDSSMIGAVEESLVDIVGLNLSPHNLDGFAAIRREPEIRRYAAKFREAISQANASGNIREGLLDLMAEALDSEAVGRHVSGAFQTLGSAANVAGLVPVVGTIATLVGMSADAGSRVASRRQANSEWYLLGPKMHHVAVQAMLRSRRKKR